MGEVRIGVLGLQGDVSEHVEMIDRTLESMNFKGKSIIIKKTEQIEKIDGLIIPGGESTTIGKMADRDNLVTGIIEKANAGMPMLCTCAGLILVARKVEDFVIGEVNQPILKILEVEIIRNAFGRQKESFEVDLSIPIIGKKPFRGVFIRSPSISSVLDNKVKVLATFDNKIIAVKQDNLFGFSFHPELTEDMRIHKLLIDSIIARG